MRTNRADKQKEEKKKSAGQLTSLVVPAVTSARLAAPFRRFSPFHSDSPDGWTDGQTDGRRDNQVARHSACTGLYVGVIWPGPPRDLRGLQT